MGSARLVRALRLFGIVGLLMAWLALRPAELGGRLHYLVVQGGSMLPVIRPGDLVVVAPADRYGFGDLVAYEAPAVPGRPILHRIVGGDERGWLLRGDARSDVDAARPSSGELLGRAVVHVQAGGVAVRILRPILVGLGAALLVVLVLERGMPRRHGP